MSQEANSGYKGEALSALTKAGCQVGDIIRVTSKEKTYEGILIPRSETGDSAHVVVKLKSGYNVGVHVTPDVKIEKAGKGAKPIASLDVFCFGSPATKPEEIKAEDVIHPLGIMRGVVRGRRRRWT